MSLSANFSASRDDFALNFSIEVEPGETVAVVGPSGAGKTTALACLAGLLRPHNGSIRNGSSTWFDSASRTFVPAHRRNVAMVFAGGALFGHLSGLGNAEFGLLAGGEAPHDARKKALDALEIVGASHLAGRRASTLSAGEVQRVALARAVALTPRVLLLDEPLSALDIRLRPLVRDALRKAIDATRAATVLVVHEPAEALLFARRFVVLEDGSVKQSGELAALRERPASGYVASFAGVNFYRGLARPLGDGSSVVLAGGGEVVVQGDYAGEISFTVDPDTVTLSADAPHTSARNVFRGPVEEIASDRGAFRVTLSSSPPITARVTAHSLSALDMAAGVQLYAAFKAVEARIL